MPDPSDFEGGKRVATVDESRKMAFAILTEAGITDRQSRCDLATFLLKRDIETWSDLSRVEWGRICDALNGWQMVRELRRQSGRLKD